MRRTDSGIPVTGISSLLTIFAVLCLVVFAWLTLSTAEAARTLSDKAVSAAQGYYQADAEAERTLAALRAGSVPAHVRNTGDIFYYDHPISDTQTLMVEVRLHGSRWEILRWQAVSTADRPSDDRLPVWSGNTEEGTT